jgi:phage host-nuclease inhibitor protein Gam
VSNKKSRIKTNAIEAPASQEEAEQLLSEIGKLQRRVTKVEANMNDKLAVIKDEFEKRAQPLNDEITGKFQALHAWAEANKGSLLKGKLKTVKLSSGELSWRTSPPSVRITGVATVIKNLKALGLTEFVRTKDEVNKEAILNDQERVEGVKGISITQKEEFVAKPFESEIERAEPVKKKAA